MGGRGGRSENGGSRKGVERGVEEGVEEWQSRRQSRKGVEEGGRGEGRGGESKTGVVEGAYLFGSWLDLGWFWRMVPRHPNKPL